MRKLLIAVACLALAAAHAAAPGLEAARLELRAKVLQLAVCGGQLYVAYDNGSVIRYELPSLRYAGALLSLKGVRIVGMGPVDYYSLAVALSDGTLLVLDARTGHEVLRASLVGRGEELEKAVISGRRVVAVVRYRHGGGWLDRLVVYDLSLRARVFERDVYSEDRLVYVFDVKTCGELLLLVYIDTTCEICKLTDTLVDVYNMTSFVKLFSRRLGECVADLDSSAVVAVNVRSGEGVYYSFSGVEGEFRVKGEPIDVRVKGGVGYVLLRTGKGVALSRVTSSSVIPLSNYEEGLRIAFLGEEPLVAGVDYLYVGDYKLRVANLIPPQRPARIVEYEGGVVLLYGKRLLYSVYPQARGLLIVRTEPGARVEVRPGGLKVVTDEHGVARIELDPGSYEVRVSKEGFVSSSSIVEVRPGLSTEIEIPLTRVRAAPQNSTLRVIVVDESTGLPLSAAVYVYNGSSLAAVKSTGGEYVLLSLKPGNYTLKVSAEGYEEGVVMVSLRPGEYREVSVPLRDVKLLVCTVPEASLRLAGEGGVALEPASREGSCLVFRRVPPGNYAVMVEEGCKANISEIHVGNSSLRVSVRVECGVEEVNASKVIEGLASYVVVSRNVTSRLPRELLVVRDIDGEVVRLDRGVVVLFFFYTKCPGCEILMSRMSSVEEQGAEIVMISPSIYDTRETLDAYRSSKNLTWHMVLDEDSRLTRALNVSSFPTVVVLEDGEVKYVGIGAAEEVPQLAEEALSALGPLAKALEDPAVISAIIGAAMLAWAAASWRRGFKGLE
ncbi:MAG: hypothetical protein DRJ57_04055 [Thermoprotei archaeon]|nr:MAG: hypothetical protein DRJ57_04055 [Thermoprotei archaeon]